MPHFMWGYSHYCLPLSLPLPVPPSLCVCVQRLAVDKSDAYRFASANKDVNKAKNRYVNVLPCELSVVM